jgi:hypothetical protein
MASLKGKYDQYKNDIDLRVGSAQTITVTPKDGDYLINTSNYGDNDCVVNITCETAKIIIKKMKDFIASVKNVNVKVSSIMSDIESKSKEFSKIPLLENKYSEIIEELFQKKYKENIVKKIKTIQSELITKSISLEEPLSCTIFKKNRRDSSTAFIININMSTSSFDIKVGTNIIKDVKLSNLCFIDNTGKEIKGCDIKQDGGSNSYLNNVSSDVIKDDYIDICE